LNLRWEMTGATGRVQRLKVELEAREEATYRRGTRTSTDRNVFARLPLLDTQDPLQIRSGSIQATLPRESVPSWNGGNNRIIWELKVRGEIPRYPDLDDTYPFTTLPPSRG
jgi:hypothetical protein